MINMADLIKKQGDMIRKQSRMKITEKLKKEGGPGSGPHDDEDNPFDVNEVNFEKIKLPSAVERFLNKFVDSMKSANLNRIKRSAILYKVINASGMSVQQLMADVQKIKKELK